MSAILAVLWGAGAPPDEAVVVRMQAAMAHRGHDRTAVWQGDGVTMAVQRAAWECTPDFAGDELLYVSDDVVVAADARLYYQGDLQRTVQARGVPLPGAGAGALIAAAYRAFGADCAAQLEGDFAFALWDRRRRVLVASRDVSGARALFHARLQPPGERPQVAVASGIRALRQHPWCPDTLDLTTLVSDAANLLFSVGDGTAYTAIRQVPAGSTLRAMAADAIAGDVHPSRWFTLPVREGAPRPLADAAAQLRALLQEAVAERVVRHAPDEPTTVWMSGGYDSPAVAGTLAQVATDARLPWMPVSASYPAGHSGREDDLIAAVATHLRTAVQWVPGEAIPPAAPVPATPPGAVARDEAFAHLHDEVLTALAQGSRAANARVALHGHAGDFLFQCHAWYLSDLLRGGRLPTLWREWRALGLSARPRTWFWKYAVEPALPAAALHLLERARGRRFAGAFERDVPAWLRTPATDRLALHERMLAGQPDTRTHGAAHAEFRWYFENQGFARLTGVMHGGILAHGVEARSPFHDLRLVHFMAQGTWQERFAQGDTKHVLRVAMAPLLPPAVLARREERTGTLATRLAEAQAGVVRWFREREGALRLEDLGVLDRAQLDRHLEHGERHAGQEALTEALLRTAHVESFLRHEGDSAS